MKKIDLVFRTIGERTSDLALELAIRHIQPSRVHIIENVRPFARAVAQMLEIQHDCEHVVHMDADCLILEDMRPFLEYNNAPYVDCYVCDRFRGRIHCGVHITRTDVVREMARIQPPLEDLAYVLRPESRLRNKALRKLKAGKHFKGFRILHDHYQSHKDVYAKYALRELRSRTPNQLARLEASMDAWVEDAEYLVANTAIDETRARISCDATAAEIHEAIAQLPDVAEASIRSLQLPPQKKLTLEEVMNSGRGMPPKFSDQPNAKIFGLGLSRTGTRSLTTALHILGWDLLHYPIDAQTLDCLVKGDYRFPCLDYYDGITDITVSPYFAQLDKLYPGSKFILTVRDKESWLRSCANHWAGRSAFAEATTPDQTSHMEVRRLLRAANFGCYEFNAERFAWVYDQHVQAVTSYFKDRPESLLVLDIIRGDGWDELCRFLGQPDPHQPFPHKGAKLSRTMAELELVGD